MRGRTITRARDAVTRCAIASEETMPLCGIHRRPWHVHRARGAECRGEEPVELARFRRWSAVANDGDQAVEDRLRGCSAVAVQACRDLSRIAEEARGLVVLVSRDQLAVFVDGLCVLFNGDADDACQPFCWIFLGGHAGGRQKREDRDATPPHKSTIHCRVNLSG